MAPTLAVQGLAHERGERSLFTGLTFGLDSGQALQVKGPNGSGKTTLLRIICGLLHADEGRVSWCGEDIHSASDEYHAQLAYVGHSHGIKADITPLENLRSMSALMGADNGTSASDALTRLGIYDTQWTLCRNLSAGQRRRVGLARLAQSAARLWVMDEPFTALDRQGIEVVSELLAEHVTAGGLLVITSHQPVVLAGINAQNIDLGGPS